MSETKFTPAAAYRRCVREIESLIECSEDLALDEITVESLRTAIHALKTGPELYEALDRLFGADMEYCMHMDGKADQLEAIDFARATMAKARGELP